MRHTSYLSSRHRLLSFLCAAFCCLGSLVVLTPAAFACDRCNARFLDSLFAERANSLLAQDALLAMRNQRQYPFHSQTNAPLVPRIEALDETALPQAVGGRPLPERTAEAEQDRQPTADAAAAGDPYRDAGRLLDLPTVGPRLSTAEDDLAPAFRGLQFLDVVRENEALSVRPPSTVAQDTPPDREFDVVLHEGSTYLGQGVVYEGFMINGSIPGPTLIVDEGDIVRMNIRNEGTVPHGASIHAAYTQTSAYVGKVDPGETKSVTFRATHPGVYMYHCAPGGHAIPMHVLAGQYGMLVVRPTTQQYELERILGRGPDVDIYLLQHEFYGSGYDAIRSSPMYTAFNGRTFRYVEEPISARPGDYIRLHFLNVGPNLVSTFHIVGILWDFVYWQGLPENRMTGGQTITSGPSDSWVVEFRAPPDEGAYLMLNHAVGPTTRGAIGILSVSAENERTPLILADGEVRSTDEMATLRAEARRIVAPFGIGTAAADDPVRFDADTTEVTVRILGNSYHPKVIEIEPGTTVRWVNEDVFAYMQGEFAGIHNAIGIRGPANFSTPLLAHAESATFTFTASGEYDYMCSPHPYMRGRVIVRQPVVAAEPAQESGGCSASPMRSPAGAGWVLVLALLALRGSQQRRSGPKR